MSEKNEWKRYEIFVPEIPTTTLLYTQPLFPSAADKVAIVLVLVLYKMLGVFLLVWGFFSFMLDILLQTYSMRHICADIVSS